MQALSLPPAPSAVAAMFDDERDHDCRGVALPLPEVHVVVRMGPWAIGGLDLHVLGAREKVHRKDLHRGLRTVIARLRLGATEAVLGAPASTFAGRIVPLDDLWGAPATRRLAERIAAAPDRASMILEGAIDARATARPGPHTALAVAAAARLTGASVNAVADDLGVSERHLRRVFRESIGMSPKAFARLRRFRHALRAARTQTSWASIAAEAGYYDQAHLIAEFRAIAGVTPRALVEELRAATSMDLTRVLS